MAEDPVPRRGDDDDSSILRLILATQNQQVAEIVQLRIDLATLQVDMKQVKEVQQSERMARHSTIEREHSEMLLTTAQISQSERDHATEHEKIWTSINTLRVWGRAIALVSSILIFILTVFVFFLEFNHVG